MKGSRVETVEAARKEYKKLLEEGWKKLQYLKAISRYFFKPTNRNKIFYFF